MTRRYSGRRKTAKFDTGRRVSDPYFDSFETMEGSMGGIYLFTGKGPMEGVHVYALNEPDRYDWYYVTDGTHYKGFPQYGYWPTAQEAIDAAKADMGVTASRKRATVATIEDSFYNEMQVGDVFYEVGTGGFGGPRRVFEDAPYTILSISEDDYDEPSCTVSWEGREFEFLQSEMDYDGMYISKRALDENRPVDVNGTPIHPGDCLMDYRWADNYLLDGGDPEYLEFVEDFNFTVENITLDGWNFGVYGYDHSDQGYPSWSYTAEELRQNCLIG